MISRLLSFYKTLSKKPVISSMLFLAIALSVSINEQAVAGNSDCRHFQDTSVRGKIMNDKAEPLEGATVTTKGTPSSVTTGADGSFRLKTPLTSTLIISMVGYASQEIPLNDYPVPTI